MGKLLSWALLALVHATLVFGQEPSPYEILKWSEADQIAWINKFVAEGMPASDTIGSVIHGRTSITLPLLEQRIEKIVRSSSPKTLFSSPEADPKRVVSLAAMSIAEAGNELSLQEASKLIKFDEQRFAFMVGHTLVCA